MSDLPFSFCGCRENPFGVNPDPRFLFWAVHVERAFGRIVLGLRDRAGLIVLTGEAGTGKTTLLYRLIDSLRPSETPVAFIFNSRLESGDLWRLIFAEFRVPWIDESQTKRKRRFQEWLIDEYRVERTPVLIIDEAQGLSEEVLKELLSLLELSANGPNLLQVLLSGQPELDGMLKGRELQRLRERVAVWQRTRALTLVETESYVRHRASLAGASESEIFDGSAIQAIHDYSQGIPRLINLVSERALRDAHSRHTLPVAKELICDVAHDFQLEAERPAAIAPSFLWTIPEETAHEAGLLSDVSDAASAALTLQEVDALLAGFRRQRHYKVRPVGAVEASLEASQPVPQVSHSFPVPTAQPGKKEVDATPTLRHSRNRAIRIAAVLRSKTRHMMAPTRVTRAHASTPLQNSLLKALGRFLTNPMPDLHYVARIERRWNRLSLSVHRAAPEKAASFTEVSFELIYGLRYFPQASLEFAAQVFACLEFVPNWILSPRWRERCSTLWKRHRHSYDSLLHWLRGPLPF